VLLVAGQVYSAAGDLARAEEVLKQLLTINPANSDVYDQLGQVYANAGRMEEAERQFVALAEHEGSREYGLTLAAVLAHAQGKLDVARQRYEKVVAANPQAAVAANNLAWLYAEQGTNLDVALNLAQSANRAAPDDVNFLDTLGVVLSKKGLWDMAITELREAARRSDNNPTIYLHLAQALAGKGSDAEARETARKALAIDPNFPEADQARRLVESKPAAANREKGD
jgi:tetratricopeptide (TPR) repeat protein